MRILPNINGHDDLLRLSDSERTILCREIREFLVSGVSKTGGHLASNLGAVELSVAIETVFNTMEDRLVFDPLNSTFRCSGIQSSCLWPVWLLLPMLCRVRQPI